MRNQIRAGHSSNLIFYFGIKFPGLGKMIIGGVFG